MSQLAHLNNQFQGSHTSITIFAAKERWRLHKDQTSRVAFGTSKPSFYSKNKQFYALLRAPNKPVSLSNPRPSLTASQDPKYIKNDFQWIAKLVLKARLPTTYKQDGKTLKDLLEQALKPKIPDIRISPT